MSLIYRYECMFALMNVCMHVILEKKRKKKKENMTIIIIKSLISFLRVFFYSKK